MFAFTVVFAACGGGGASPTPGATDATPAATAAQASTGSDEAPQRDLIDLAQRFRGLGETPRTVELPEPAPGDGQSFHVLSFPADPNARLERGTVEAVLRATSPHAYFYVEQGADVSDASIDGAVSAFEEQVWPAVTEAFGLPPTPGIDGDPRVVLLHARLGGIGGYVSDEDSYPSAAVPTSNEREMVYLNIDAAAPGSPGYVELVSHELQHVVHGGLDADEVAWVNEGLSEIAAGLAGGYPGFSSVFLDDPDTQLNGWPALGSSTPHYGGSYLFFSYLLEQTGGLPRDIAARPENSVAGVRAFLDAAGGPAAGHGFEALVANWAVANLIDNPTGPYGYGELEIDDVNLTSMRSGVPQDVAQFGADYVELRGEELPANSTLSFVGDTEVDAVAAQAAADGAFWWSGRGDNMDARLTREIDLTGLTSATLTYRLWHDIERWFDFAYVAASTDGGATWTALPGTRTDDDDPLAVAYGPAYTGDSGGWVAESVDLSAYAGAPVLLRFEYVTDDSTHAEGLAIDDIAVAEAGFLDDGEADVGGWNREGFRRVEGPLEQRFELRFVAYGPEGPQVFEVTLDGANRGEVNLDRIGVDYTRGVLVVVGATDGTTERAGYRYEITTSE